MSDKDWVKIYWRNAGSTVTQVYRTRNEGLNIACAKDSIVNSGGEIVDIQEVAA